MDTDTANTGNAVASGPKYSLLDTCNGRLPQNEVLRELTFGRFITLSRVAVQGEGGYTGFARKVVMPLSIINGRLLRNSTDGGSSQAPIHELRTEALNSKRVPTVKVANIAQLIADRKVKLGQHFGDAVLSSSDISTLLYGGNTVVRITGIDAQKTVRLDARAAKDAKTVPLAAAHDVHDISAFLAEPVISTLNGRSVRLKLNAENVADLMNRRSTRVDGAGQVITLVPRAAASSTYAMSNGGMDSVLGEPRERFGGIARQPVTTPATGTEKTTMDVAPTYVGRQFVPESMSNDDTPSAPQLGFYVPYLQTWKLLGYSRGTLLNTISLAPQEESTIEIFTWDRNTRALEQTSSSEAEQNIESVDTTKDTSQVAKELTRDSNFKAEAHVHAQVTVEVVQAGGDAGGETGGAAKDIAKHTTDHIHESTRKATTRVRASRQSKVSETHDFGREQRITRKIRNVNMCRTLNLDYFEILANYEMTTICQRKDARLVVLVDLPQVYDWNSRQTLRRYESLLKNALLDRSYTAGFEAARLLSARDKAFEAVCEKCVCTNEANDSFTSDSTQLDDLRSAALALLTTVKALTAFNGAINATWPLLIAAPPDPSHPLTDPNPDTAQRLHRWLFLQLITRKAAAIWSGLLSVVVNGLPPNAAAITPQTLRAMHAMVTPTGTMASPLADLMNIDEAGKQILRDALHPLARALYKGVSQNSLDAMSAVAFTIPDPVVAGVTFLINKLIGGATAEVIEELASQLGIAALDAKYSLSALDDMGFLGQIAAFGEAYTDWKNASADFLKHTESLATALDTLANERNDQIRNAFPLSAVAEAREREEVLMMHLQDNSNYYSFALYQAQLANGSAEMPQLVKLSEGLISPEAMGIVQGKLAFPINLDDLPAAANPATIGALRDWFNEKIRDNVELDDGPDPSVVSLPTPGISLETRLGCCDGCEDFIMDTRKVDLRQRTALARQTEYEADRYYARQHQAIPNFDDPTPKRHDPVLTIKLAQDGVSELPAATAPTTPTL